MALEKIPRAIFIVNSDQGAARSQETLLRTTSDTIVFHRVESHWTKCDYDTNDIVLLDIDIDKSEGFATLDQFLRAPSSPKILVTIFENDILMPQDTFGEKTLKILFKPYLPDDLLAAVDTLMLH